MTIQELSTDTAQANEPSQAVSITIQGTQAESIANYTALKGTSEVMLK